MRLAALLATWLLMMLGMAAHAGDVGFTVLTISNGAEKPLTIGVWYPTDAAAKPTPLDTFTQDVAVGAPVVGHDLPLVLISHGSGGWFGGHYDTALALAHAGFVVAAAMVRHLLTDPMLPAELLPADWPGTRLRAAYHDFATELAQRRDPTQLVEAT